MYNRVNRENKIVRIFEDFGFFEPLGGTNSLNDFDFVI